MTEEMVRATGGEGGLAALLQAPMRADARRNYDRLLAAAADVFAQAGPEASLDEIARRAGVGNATLYRHFATRHDLLVAVCVGEVDSLCARGHHLSAHQPADVALLEWLRSFVEHVASKQGLAAALMTGGREGSEVISACKQAIEATAADLLSAAQEKGAIRPDVRVGDLLKLIGAIAAASESSDPADGERLLQLVLDGMRSRP